MSEARATLVSPAALAAAARFTSDDPHRPALGNVHVSPDGSLRATDGHRAVRIAPTHSEGAALEYPDAGIPAGHHAPDKAGILVPRESAAKFARTAKAMSGKSAHPVLRAVAVSTNAERASLSATNLDNTAREDFRILEERFPDLVQVWPTKAPVLRIGFNAALLAEVVTALASMSDTHKDQLGVVMEFHGPLSACVLRCQGADAEALLMPLRLPASE